MEPGPIFTKLRTIAFCCIALVSLIWTILLSVELFLRWDVSDAYQRSFTLVFVVINAVTAIMMPAMLLVHFRAYLDAARMAFLLAVHITTAIGYTTQYSNFQCPGGSSTEACRLINMYIMLGSWIVPALLLVYSFFLGLGAYLQRGRVKDQEETPELVPDEPEEVKTPEMANTPVMRRPSNREQRVSGQSFGSDSSERWSQPSWTGHQSMPVPPLQYSVPQPVVVPPPLMIYTPPPHRASMQAFPQSGRTSLPAAPRMAIPPTPRMSIPPTARTSMPPTSRVSMAPALRVSIPPGPRHTSALPTPRTPMQPTPRTSVPPTPRSTVPLSVSIPPSPVDAYHTEHWPSPSNSRSSARLSKPIPNRFFQ